MKKILINIFILFFAVNLISAQKLSEKDSLLLELKKADEKSKPEILNKISWKLRNSKPEEAIKYSKNAIILAEKYQNYKELVNGYGYSGIACRNLGNYSDAFDYYFKGLELAQKYKVREQEGYARINIGNLYIYQEYYDEAIVNLKQGLLIASELKIDKMIAYCNLYLGRSYLNKKEYKTSLEYLTIALEIRIKLKDTGAQAVCYKDIGNVYLGQNQYDSAFQNFKTALEIVDKKSDQDLHSEILNNLAITNFKLNRNDVAKKYALNSLETAKTVKSKLRIRNAYNTLSDVENVLGNSANAYKYLDLVLLYNDSLFSETLTEKISNIQQSAEHQRKQAEIDLLIKDKKIQKYKIYGLIFILLIVFVLFLIGLRINNLRKKQNILLKEQKEEIEIINSELFDKQEFITKQKNDLENSLKIQETLNQKFFAQNMQLDQTRMDLEENSIELQRKNEDLAVAEEELRQYNEELLTINENIEYQKQTITTAHKNITDSINYAKTIQNALLPKPHIIETWFKEYFVIFQPREHVSGDFYYVNKIEKYLFVAVADCTGHGVPGGFMTMLSVTQLHEIIRRFETTNTGEILNILRTRIKEIFQSFGTDNQNGLDIAFCVIDTEQNTMQYSGAFNPLVIIRNHEIIEYKATRNPIGFYPKEKAFEVHNIQLQNNDLIYLFSDGYQDQVGGNAHRKFSKQKLMELIIENNNLPLNIQKETFENNFKTWKKDEKQTDDVTFMGIKWIVK